MLLTIVTVYPVPRIANRPQAEKKMWSRCGGAPAIVKDEWRARFSMSAVDRELHELELELTGVRRRTCDRMEEKEKTARYILL
jgi:hypothetical protein